MWSVCKASMELLLTLIKYINCIRIKFVQFDFLRFCRVLTIVPSLGYCSVVRERLSPFHVVFFKSFRFFSAPSVAVILNFFVLCSPSECFSPRGMSVYGFHDDTLAR